MVPGNGTDPAAGEVLTPEEMAALASRIETELVPIPIWGGRTVRVRALTAGMRGRYRRAQAQILSGEVTMRGARRRGGQGGEEAGERRMQLDFSALPDLPTLVASMGICNAQLEALFTEEQLAGWPPQVIDLCSAAILRLSGLEEDGLQAAGKGSPEIPTASSSSDLPSPSDEADPTSSPGS